MYKTQKILTFIFLICSCLLSNAKVKVDFNAYRAKMGGEKNATAVYLKIMQEYKDTKDLTISFHKERYDFYPKESGPGLNCGMEINGWDGLTLEGNGAEFIFHGIMGVCSITHSKDVTLRDFTVDWDRPIISQCQVVNATDDYIDVHIDRQAYPCYLKDGKLVFTGEGWESPIQPYFLNIFDSNGDIQYNTWDGTLGGEFPSARVDSLSEDTYRFNYHPRYKPAPGSIIALINGHYRSFGIRAVRSQNVCYQNLTVYHTMGAGITGDFCENVTEKNVKIIANKAKGRVFSTEADAQHYRNCKGQIWLNGCECSGQEDDFINVHGVYYRIFDKTGSHTLKTQQARDFSPEEKVAFLHPRSGQREYMLTVESVTDSEVTFKEELPAAIDTTFYMENYTWTASFLFENCTATKGNRARGILFTTPKPVIIRSNYFHSAGTAILIEGDIDTWFESGACTDVNIYGNTFDNCLTSGNRDGDRWQWGDGIITITPSHRPSDAEAASYHRNIRIHDNTFRVFDTSLLRACSVDGLQFCKNKIIKTYDYKPYLYYKDSFTLEGCRNVVIGKNKFSKDYTTKTFSTNLMKPEDVKVSW